ncbi:RNA helicase [Malassezia sp. CBS 17886]|nr:RNA helicase [Malassezia sp. CBS 17886]
MATSLVLVAPTHRAGAPQDEESAQVAAEMHSRAFQFPYPIAYPMQLQLMTALFDTIEHKKAGVFESPTGTGKTLSLLCSAMTWLAMNRRRAEEGVAAGGAGARDDGDEPDWVVAHEEARQRQVLEQHDADLRARLTAVRKRMADAAERQRHAPPVKRPRTVQERDADSDSEFLVPEYTDGPARTCPSTRPHALGGAPAFVSQAVHEMMAEYDAMLGGPTVADEAPPTTPKIYYASRTHSQLSQTVGELKKTAFGSGSADRDPARTVCLGSRKQLCVNADVQRVGATLGAEAMNERCLELIESGTSKARCAYLPASDAAGRQRMAEFQDATLASVHDIEELVQLGRSMHVCPYFGARNAVREAELVLLPYNLLLHRDARESLQLVLDESVVIVDEAHNLIDTLLATYSAELTEAHVDQATAQVDAYLARFSTRLRGSNEEHLRTLQVFLAALQHYCRARRNRRETESLTVAQLVAGLGGSVDQINLVRIEQWLKTTRIARKIGGYADRQWVRGHGADAARPRSTTRAMHAVEAFLLALTDRCQNGLVLVSQEPAGGDARNTFTKLRYLLLNPEHAFLPLIESARAVVLAGGTMAPMDEFQTQLFASRSAERVDAFSCGHIVPDENILGAIVPHGPRGRTLEFTHAAWEKTDLLDELAAALSNYANIIPHGVVAFFPSYASLNSTLRHWRQSGALERLARRKQVFLEPQDAQSVDGVLQRYAEAAGAEPRGGTKGAILFAVVGAKLSEGINFQDELARCVIMIGLPFPNARSKELEERMAYARKTAPPHGATGRELYLNLCMRAVNQSMGRAIRHGDDYAVFLLLDHRYAREEIRARLPHWIRGRTRAYDKFGHSIGAMATFFREKRTTRRVT